MPVKLNVGFSRKVGEPNYGSRGASTHVEIELDALLALEPDRLREKVRSLFVLARGTVEEELEASAPHPPAAPQAVTEASGPRGRHRAATRSQVRAIENLASKLDRDLAAALRERFGRDSPSELTLPEASGLINAWSVEARDGTTEKPTEDPRTNGASD